MTAVLFPARREDYPVVVPGTVGKCWTSILHGFKGDTGHTDLRASGAHIAQMIMVLRALPGMSPDSFLPSASSDAGRNVVWGRLVGKDVRKSGNKSTVKKSKILHWKDINYDLTLRRKQQYHYCARFRSLLHLGQIQGVEPTVSFIHSLCPRY